jgi:hypothetical protein
MPKLLKLNSSILEAALEGLKARRSRVNEQIAELRRHLKSEDTAPVATSPVRRGRKRLSAAARKRISEAQKKRWAKTKKK